MDNADWMLVGVRGKVGVFSRVPTPPTSGFPEDTSVSNFMLTWSEVKHCYAESTVGLCLPLKRSNCKLWGPGCKTLTLKNHLI